MKNSQLDNREFGGLIVFAEGQLVQFLWVWWDDNIQGYPDGKPMNLCSRLLEKTTLQWQDLYYQFPDNSPMFSFGSSSAGSFLSTRVPSLVTTSPMIHFSTLSRRFGGLLQQVLELVCLKMWRYPGRGARCNGLFARSSSLPAWYKM